MGESVRPWLAAALAAGILSAGCARPEPMALAPEPPSTATGIAIPISATILIDTSGVCRVYNPEPETFYKGMWGHGDWATRYRFGVNDSFVVHFGAKKMRIYSATTFSSRRLK